MLSSSSSKAITSLVKRCCDVLVCSFERDDLEQVNVLNVLQKNAALLDITSLYFVPTPLIFKIFSFSQPLDKTKGSMLVVLSSKVKKIVLLQICFSWVGCIELKMSGRNQQLPDIKPSFEMFA